MKGNRFISDSENHRIQIFDENGTFIRKFGSEGKENGELDGPFGLGLLSNGNLVVGEYINNRISIFDNQGNFIKVIAAEDLKDPGHLFIDSDDNILITDDENQRIAIYSSQTGNMFKSIKTMENPRGIAMDRDGRIIVALWNHEIDIY